MPQTLVDVIVFDTTVKDVDLRCVESYIESVIEDVTVTPVWRDNVTLELKFADIAKEDSDFSTLYFMGFAKGYMAGYHDGAKDELRKEIERLNEVIASKDKAI